MNSKKFNKTKAELLCDTKNVDEISKNWQSNKNYDNSSSNMDTETEQCLNDSKSIISERDSEQSSHIQSQNFKKEQNQQQTQKRSHMPQIIDQDTEQFKLRLDHILNVFKTDAISEFMVMKKSMLEDQKENIKSETQRYLQMYEDKAQELMVTKQHLDDKITECVNLTAKNEGLAKLAGDAKNKFFMLKNLQKYFTTLKIYKKYKQQKKQKLKMADLLQKKSYEKKVFSAWHCMAAVTKKEKVEKQVEEVHNNEIDELTNRYNKEIMILQEKLQEVTQQLDQNNEQKQNMQENLKKAFMRGVCALNFEAMNILQPKDMNQQQIEQLIQNNFQNQSISQNQSQQSFSMPDQSTYKNTQISQNIQPVHNNLDSRTQNSSVFTQQEFDMDEKENTIQSFSKQSDTSNKTIVFYQEPRIESKDHKWKNAPVVGVQSQPQQQDLNDSFTKTEKFIENNSNFMGHSQLPDLVGQKLNTGHTYNEVLLEGRVIKVNTKSVKFDDNVQIQSQQSKAMQYKSIQQQNKKTNSTSNLKNGSGRK